LTVSEDGVSIDLADRLELHELAARYGTVVDDRDWDGLALVFTDDATFELNGFGEIDGLYDGLAAIRALMEKGPHPIAHHVTNVLVDVDVDGAVVRMRSKIVGTLERGRAGSVDYADVVRREPAGWRIASRAVRLRRPKP
jgi:3-phenylpropionate/cinnamic acid dioxygenase small subunit